MSRDARLHSASFLLSPAVPRPQGPQRPGGGAYAVFPLLKDFRPCFALVRILLKSIPGVHNPGVLCVWQIIALNSDSEGDDPAFGLDASIVANWQAPNAAGGSAFEVRSLY